MKQVRRALVGGMLMVLAGWLAGCSATAMKAAPRWDRDYGKALGPAENRVNLWPVYYYRDPAWALAWPLVSVTDEGSAVVPLYEHDKTKKELRVLYVHQFLPSAATFMPTYTRVLNAIRDRRAGKDRLDVLPLYYQDFAEPSLLVLPVYYKDDDTFWTPLYAKTRHLTGVLGPLFNVYKDGETKTYNMPWPVAGVRKGPETNGFWVLPAIAYDRTGKASHLNLGAVLMDWKKDEDSWRTFYAAFLGGAGREANGDRLNYFIPFWGAWRDGERKGVVSLPYTSYQNGDKFSVTAVMLNGWIDVQNGEDRHQGVLWPLFQRFERDGARGTMVLPVFYDKRKGDDHTLVTPLGGFARSAEGAILDVGGPLYFHKRGPGEKLTAVCWPVFTTWEDKQGKGFAALPLAYYQAKADGGRVLVTPLGGMSKSEDEEFFDLGGPLFLIHRNLRTEERYRSIAWPLWHEVDQNNRKVRTLLPVFTWSRRSDGKWSWISLPVSFGRDGKEHFLNVGALLFHHQQTETRTQNWLLANLIGWEREKQAGEFGVHAFPLFSYKDTPDYQRFSAILSGYYQSKTDEATMRAELRDPLLSPKSFGYPNSQLLNERHALGFLFKTETWIKRAIEPLGEGEKPGKGEVEVKDEKAAGNGRRKAVVRKETETWLLPLAFYGKTVEGQGSERYVLWRLYDSISKQKPEGAVYTRQRVLWRMFHREAEGERVSVDLFPFITWDRDKDFRQFSFAGGLLGGGSKDGKGFVRVLWVKF